MLTKEKMQSAGIDPEKIRKLAELFPNLEVLTENNFQEAGFDQEDIINVFDTIYGPHTIIRAAYLTKEKLQEADVDNGIIQKFAELFPNGTEVTSELCETYPDIFSFGKQPRPFRGIDKEHNLVLSLALCKVTRSSSSSQ